MSKLLAVHASGHPLRIAVERHGEGLGAPLVFLHGLGSSSLVGLRHIADHPALAGHERVLIDLPGFGHSPAPATWFATIEDQAAVAAAVMEAMDLSPATIVGHSMGGSVAITLAARWPERVTRLIVAEPLLDPGEGTLSAHIARQTEAAFVARGFAALRMATRRQAARGETASIAFLRTLELADPAVMHRSAVSLLANRSPGFRDQFAALGIPRTFFAGARSGIDTTPLRNAGVDTVVIPDAGHSMMDEQPDAFARVVAEASAG